MTLQHSAMLACGLGLAIVAALEYITHKRQSRRRGIRHDYK